MFELSPHLLSAITAPDAEDEMGTPWCQILYQNAASRQHHGDMHGADLALQPSLLAQIFAIEGHEAMQVGSNKKSHVQGNGRQALCALRYR